MTQEEEQPFERTEENPHPLSEDPHDWTRLTCEHDDFQPDCKEFCAECGHACRDHQKGLGRYMRGQKCHGFKQSGGCVCKAFEPGPGG